MITSDVLMTLYRIGVFVILSLLAWLLQAAARSADKPANISRNLSIHFHRSVC